VKSTEHVLFKSTGVFFAVVFGLFLLGAHSPASDASPIAAADLQWSLQNRPQDKVSLAVNDEALQLDFIVQADTTKQVGHQSFQTSTILLLLKDPQPLSQSTKRILFEVCGMQPSAKKGTVLLLMPVFLDANGERLVYNPHKAQHLYSGTKKWSGWKTHSFYSTEAGGAATDSFTATGGDGNAWPDGQLTFLGFEITVRANNTQEYSDHLEIGSIAFGGDLIPYHDPYVYADALLEKTGTYQIATQVLNKFQDTPVREITDTLQFDPARPSLCKQKISFTLGPDDNYWIRYQIKNAQGDVVATDQMRTWVEGNNNAPAPTPVDLNAAPSIGVLRINPGHATCGVYERSKEATLTIRAFAKDFPDGFTLNWRIERFAFPEIVTQKSQAVSFGKNGKTPSVDIPIPLDLPAECDAYKLIAEACIGEKTIDRQEYVFGFRTDMSKKYQGRIGPRTTREDVKKSAYVRISYLPMRNGKRIDFTSRDEALNRFDAAIEKISQITPNVTYMIDTASFEVLPGVFDFELLDKIMDKATDYGCRLTLRLSHANHGTENLLRWQRYWPQRNSDGTINSGHDFYGSFSVADRNYLDSFLNGFKALHDRYEKHPAFQGYQIFEIAGEWAVLDQPWNGSIVSYEKVARDAFTAYVRKHITTDLPALNKRWKTAFASWKDVTPPQPTMEQGTAPDLRLYWLDFMQFKHELDTKVWITTAAGNIRTYDNDAVIIVYNLDPGGFEDASGVSTIDFLHNGGNHFLRGEGSLVSAWNNNKVGWITEPHQPHCWAAYGDKGDRGWLLDWTTYIMLAQAGAGGANMHIYYLPLNGNEDLSLTAHYGREYAFDRFEQWMPLLREMHGVQIKQTPPQIAVTQDIFTLFCKHRTVFEPRMDDLRRWFELLKNDSLDYEDFRAENSGSYKLILPNILDEVMSKDSITTLQNQIASGKKAVISAMCGSHCPEMPAESFALLKALGIKAPEKSFTTTSENVSASVSQTNPFFKTDSAVPFFTLADMKRKLQDPNMKDWFYQWPYRWLPQTDYFRVYFGHNASDGKIIATFTDGSTAVSLHKYGKGEVLVFWGLPDYSSESMKGFMQNVAEWAGVENHRKGNPVPLTMEGDHEKLNRHYAIMYQDEPGTYCQKLPLVPEGEYFVDNIVDGARYGVFTAKELHDGVNWTWYKGQSPLKILRMIPKKEMRSRWVDKYQDVITKGQ